MITLFNLWTQKAVVNFAVIISITGITIVSVI